MDNSRYLNLNTSILYRCGQKYYDKKLCGHDINASQILFLILIYEQEGLNMQQLAQKGCFDKGTVTKSISRLEELGYVATQSSPEDKRIRLLFTTDKTKDIIRDIYMIRQQWWELLSRDIDADELHQFELTLSKLSENARQYEQQEEAGIKLFGIQKLTLLDYPQKMASTIFTGGCNFRCPFCQNSDLVFLPENMPELQEEDVLRFLEKRKGILDGVCISGGEPLLNPELAGFLRKIKALGYAVKLDTNGSSPEKLKQLVEEGLLDYVAMDIKNSVRKYAETAGIRNLDLQGIQDSITYLKEGHIPYEFRTTIVKEFHSAQDIRDMTDWLEGAAAWYLQNFEDSDHVIQRGLHAWDKETLKAYLEIARTKIPNTELRGI
ncbi:anaerobic ribonucleoside-triphosphate reductase activating protein [[Clostridium] innocuum]|nr:anaerobic ribonucleoside-triphosphate reductase activating protein [[Clostridium] innocuum]